MDHLAKAAAADFNANIAAIKNAATAEMLDTVVSVAEASGIAKLSVTVSNPHVLKPVTTWKASSGTPLWSAMVKLIKLHNSLPDTNNPNVSSLILVTTDGEANYEPGVYSELKELIAMANRTGRWSFVFRLPEGARQNVKQTILDLGIPEGNIQSWETTAAGMAASTAKTTQAMANFFTARSAGASSTSAFYTDASKVNVAALDDVTKKVSLYVVPQEDNGIELRPFILRHRMEYLKGSAFYQLTKTESRVSYTKQVLVRDQATGKIFAGKEARKMIGLPSDRNARLHPGDHKNFDLFIQSESVNRKLVGGTGVVYWKEIGTPFTEADLAYLKPKDPVPAKAPVVQLAKVPVSNKPTKSPVPVTPKAHYFETREEARIHCAAVGKPQSAIQKNLHATIKRHRWMV